MENRVMPVHLKRKDFYLLEKIYTDLAVRILPFLARTPLTPNQITLVNYMNGGLTFYCIATGRYLAAAILIQLYLFLDILDGNLARLKNMATRLGRILDHVGDRLFYNGVMIVLGLATPVHMLWIAAYLIVYNLYAIVATYYIAPVIRQMAAYQRFGLKRRLMERGIILGMDLSAHDLIMTAFIATPWRTLIIPLVTALYLLDLVYRLIELAVNRRSAPA